MAALSKTRLAEVLTRRLNLASPEFRLEKLGSGLSGSVISDTFRGIDNYRRQKLLWNALEAEFGERARAMVGTLLPYTHAEWYVDLEFGPAPARKKPAKASAGGAPRAARTRSIAKR